MAGVPNNPLMASMLRVTQPKPQSGFHQRMVDEASKVALALNSSPFSQAVNSDLSRNTNSIVQALAAPGNAAQGLYNYAEVSPSGEVAPFNRGIMDAASNMAGVVSLGSAPIPRPKGSLGMGGAPKENLNTLLEAARKRIADRDAAVSELASSGNSSVRMKGAAGQVLVGPDVSKPGGFRVTYFDTKGTPNGHVETKTYDEAIRRAFLDGFNP